MRRLGAAIAMACLLAVSSAGLASAGKGTLTVDPNPVVRGDSFTLAGCGYPVPTSISFHVVGPNVDYFTAGEPLAADSNGCFTDTWLAWWPDAGKYQITSYYRDSKGATHRVTVVKFTVT